MKEDFPYKTNKTLKAYNDKLFLVDTNSPRLDKEKSNTFHVFTMKFMFLDEKERSYIEPGVEFLSNQTNVSTHSNKLVQLLDFTFVAHDDILAFKADDSDILN